MSDRHDTFRPLIDPLEFTGVTYDLNSSYVDRTGSVWSFDDTISAVDGTWDMRTSDHCYAESLADVILNWGPLKACSTKSKASLHYRHLPEWIEELRAATTCEENGSRRTEVSP
jgi:hypothetical protein